MHHCVGQCFASKMLLTPGAYFKCGLWPGTIAICALVKQEEDPGAAAPESNGSGAVSATEEQPSRFAPSETLEDGRSALVPSAPRPGENCITVAAQCLHRRAAFHPCSCSRFVLHVRFLSDLNFSHKSCSDLGATHWSLFAFLSSGVYSVLRGALCCTVWCTRCLCCSLLTMRQCWPHDRLCRHGSGAGN